MNLLETDFTQNIFTVLTSQPAQLENLSNNALSNGIDLYTKEDYNLHFAPSITYFLNYKYHILCFVVR